MEFERLLADRTEKMGVNAIREILKVVSQPGMISLAGGIPAPESFPIDIIRELTSIVFDKYSSKALQYDPTEGFYPLRQALADYLQKNYELSSDRVVALWYGAENPIASNDTAEGRAQNRRVEIAIGGM